MAANMLVPDIIPMTSTAMVLNIPNKYVFIFHEKNIPTTCAIGVLKSDSKRKYIFVYLNKDWFTIVLCDDLFIQILALMRLIYSMHY